MYKNLKSQRKENTTYRYFNVTLTLYILTGLFGFEFYLKLRSNTSIWLFVRNFSIYTTFVITMWVLVYGYNFVHAY